MHGSYSGPGLVMALFRRKSKKNPILINRMSQYPIPDFRISLLRIWEYFNERTMNLHTPERSCAPSINVNVSRPYKTNTVDVVGGPTSSVGCTRRCSSAPMGAELHRRITHFQW